MQPQAVINNAIDLAKTAIGGAGKPSSVKLKVKFDNGKKIGAIKRRASKTAYHMPDKGVTR